MPPQTEFEDSFNSKFETNYSADETTLNRQNDSASSTENLTSPFQKSFETHLAAKSMEPLSSQSCKSEPHTPLSEPYQGIQILNNLTLTHHREKTFSVKEELLFDTDKIEYGTRNLSLREGKRSGKGNENKRYLNPVLNEIEPKNRKIDKIVENLKCNQRKSHETHSPVSRGKSQLTGEFFNWIITNVINYQGVTLIILLLNALFSDLQKTFLNLSSSNMEQLERINAQKLSSPDILSRSKAADIFAGSNIFMETDPDNVTGSDLSADNVPSTIKTETDSSPEIIPDLKYIPLSPGIQSIGIHSPTNTKLYATCYVCHKQLSNQYNLRVHLETHQNARHACVACNHVSRSRDALRKHVSYRHPQLNTSHSVGRPCKANQNTPNTLQTPPSVSSIFNFPSPAIDAGESIDLSANTNTAARHSSGADVTSNTNASRSFVSVDNNNSLSNSAKMPTEKHD